MNFCKSLCDNDSDCQAFEYDYLNPGKKENCKAYSFSGYKGNGNEQAICFVKNDGAEVIDWAEPEQLTKPFPNSYCGNSSNRKDFGENTPD